MDIDQLASVAQQLVAPAKGILAADESGPTIQKRFDSIGVNSTEESRRDYRELLFRTDGASDYISGVILYDETLRQKAADGTPLVDGQEDHEGHHLQRQDVSGQHPVGDVRSPHHAVQGHADADDHGDDAGLHMGGNMTWLELQRRLHGTFSLSLINI